MNRLNWLFVPMCACLVLSACGDDDEGDAPTVDGGKADGGDSGAALLDGGMDSGLGNPSDGGVRPDAGFADMKQVKLAISATGHDRFLGVAYDGQGNVFAVGQSATGVNATDDSALLLAKFSATGELDKSFGAPNGYVIQNVNAGGQNVEAGRGIVVQKFGANAGKIVVAGEADRPGVGLDAGVVSRDTDIVLVRFLATGAIDPSFGTAGVVRLPLGQGVAVTSTLPDGGTQTSLSGAASAWNLVQTSDGKLVVHGASRAEGTASDGGVRTDNDYTLVRLTENGALDTSFATTGILLTDVGEVNGSARSATVLSDDSVVAAGYTTSSVLGQSTQQPVLYKVSPTGARDATFGSTDAFAAVPGVWHDFARSDKQRAEAYGAALQGDKFVTVGYGPTPTSTGGSGTDWVFFRFNADGSQDKSFGTGGETFLDVGKYSDNGRAITILPGNRVLGVGGGRPTPATAPAAGAQPSNVDGMVAVLDANGQPDPTFGTGGYRLFDWGDADFLHACAVAPGQKQVAIVGAANSGRTPTSPDDAVLILWTLP